MTITWCNVGNSSLRGAALERYAHVHDHTARHMGNTTSNRVWAYEAVDTLTVPEIQAPLPSSIAIAHVIAGETRTFANPATHGSLLVNAVGAAAVGASGSHARDVFVVLLSS